MAFWAAAGLLPVLSAEAACRGEGVVRSRVSETTTTMAFVNRSAGPVSVYWLDFGGSRVRYQVLEAGTSYTQQTYLTHPWVVVDAQGRCRGPFMPRRQLRQITVR